MTVINGPPERSRTRSPLRNDGAGAFCIAGVDEAGAEEGGDKGIPSVSPSVTAIATEACLVDANILNSILKLCGLRVAALGQLAAAAALGVAPGSARMYKTCCGIGESKSGYQQFVKGLAAFPTSPRPIWIRWLDALPSAPAQRSFTFHSDGGDIVPHFDQTSFNQGL